MLVAILLYYVLFICIHKSAPICIYLPFTCFTYGVLVLACLCILRCSYFSAELEINVGFSFSEAAAQTLLSWRVEDRKTDSKTEPHFASRMETHGSVSCMLGCAEIARKLKELNNKLKVWIHVYVATFVLL